MIHLWLFFEDIGFKYGIVVKEANWEVDHIHILFEAKPSTNLVKFINSYKSASSRLIKKQYPVIKKRVLWKSAFWKTGYFITTAGGANIETVRQYIERQREK